MSWTVASLFLVGAFVFVFLGAAALAKDRFVLFGGAMLICWLLLCAAAIKIAPMLTTACK
jgi:hypothetical protein